MVKKNTQAELNGDSHSVQRLVRQSAWTGSKVEEVIAALWAIAALCAWMAELRWIAWCLLAKVALDVLCAILLAVIEIKAESKNMPNV